MFFRVGFLCSSRVCVNLHFPVFALFMPFDLVIFMFFFFFSYRFDVHVLLFWVCSLILDLMSLLGLFLDLRRTLKNKFLCSHVLRSHFM